MKKIMVILACVAMLFSFASCDDSPSGPAVDTDVMAADVLKAFADVSTSGFDTAFAAGEVTEVTGEQAADKTATVKYSVAVPASTAGALRVTGGELAFTLNTTGASTTISSATMEGSVNIVVGAYEKHTIYYNGAVTLTGITTTVTAATTSAPASATVDGTLSAIALSEKAAITVDGGSVNNAVVFEQSGLEALEVAEVKADVATLQTALLAALKNADAYTVAADKLTVVAEDALGEGVDATLVIAGETEGTTFTVAAEDAYTLTVSGFDFSKAEIAVTGLTTITVDETVTAPNPTAVAITGTVVCDGVEVVIE